MPVSATPALHRVFDVYVPRFEREMKAYSSRCARALDEAARRLGVKEPETPPRGASPEAWEAYCNARRIHQTVDPHIAVPKPLLVRVRSIDALLDDLYTAA